MGEALERPEVQEVVAGYVAGTITPVWALATLVDLGIEAEAAARALLAARKAASEGRR